MAAIVFASSRKRSASPFLDEAFPAPPHLTKRGRFTPAAAAAAVAPPPQPLIRQQSTSSREAAASRISRAATDGDCAAVLVEQLAAAADVADAKNIASWIMSLFKDAVAERAVAALRQENTALKAQAASSSTEAASLKEENNSLRAQAASSLVEITKLREENASLKNQAAALGHDNSVLKRGVVLLNTRQEEAASEMKKKVAELEMANYTLTVRLRDADNCRFQQAFRDAF